MKNPNQRDFRKNSLGYQSQKKLRDFQNVMIDKLSFLAFSFINFTINRTFLDFYNKRQQNTFFEEFLQAKLVGLQILKNLSPGNSHFKG